MSILADIQGVKALLEELEIKYKEEKYMGRTRLILKIWVVWGYKKFIIDFVRMGIINKLLNKLRKDMDIYDREYHLILRDMCVLIDKGMRKSKIIDYACKNGMNFETAVLEYHKLIKWK